MDNAFITNEKEFDVLSIIEKNNDITQRELSKRTGLSLGLTNIIIKRLIRKGYLKVKKMNKRRILYYLTPKAIVDKTNRTYNYITKSINIVMGIKKRLVEELASRSILDKYDKFAVVGSNEISEVVKWTLSELGKHICYKYNKEDVFVINCGEDKITDAGDFLDVFEVVDSVGT